MSLPVNKVEVWEPGAGSALYSLTNEVLSLYSKEILTDAIGHFNFMVPTKKNGSTYYYNDIDAFDIVKIWYGYGTIAGDPNFIGRVGSISAPLSVKGGFIRVISGQSQSEILQRRFKSNKLWNAIDASQIVTGIATDLGILHAADIDADTNDETIEVKTRSYFDILREVSDYWIDASNKVQKDFWVDIDGHLHWKARPVRTVGVETFTVGTNILNYNVTQQIDPVKNNITVKGAAEKPLPLDKDWCETLTNWTAQVGSIDLNAVAPKVGTYTLRAYTLVGAATSTFKRTFDRITIRDINQVKFWEYIAAGGASTAKVRLLAPDTSNYFQADMDLTAGWHWKEYSLGPNQEYDVAKNPNGVWTLTGSPNWYDIQAIQFHIVYSDNDHYSHFDGLYFNPDRWIGTATNAASITAYGQRDFEVEDDKLHLDADCTKRAETLLLMNKDLPKQVEVTVTGNTNVLIGDRVPLTVPAENISAVNFDIVAVEHSFTNQGFYTKATTINSLNTRQLLETQPVHSIAYLKRAVRDLSYDIKKL